MSLHCPTDGKAMNSRTYNILFLCTGNSARSILAESIMNRLGNGRFRASVPAVIRTGGQSVGARAAEAARTFPPRACAARAGMSSRRPASPHFDFIITVCDNAAGEVCPVWLGNPTTAHWGIADPAAVEGSDEEKRAAFALASGSCWRASNCFVNLPLAEPGCATPQGGAGGYRQYFRSRKSPR